MVPPPLKPLRLTYSFRSYYQQDNNKPAAIAALQAGITTPTCTSNWRREELVKRPLLSRNWRLPQQTINQTPSQPSMFGSSPMMPLRWRDFLGYSALKMPAHGAR